jgi:hypothetical protein
VAERLANVEELAAAATRLDDPVVTSQVWSLRYRAMMEIAQVAEADRALDAFAALAEELGQPAIRWQVDWPRTARLVMVGRLTEAERVGAETMALGVATGQDDAVIIQTFGLLPIRLEQDRLAEFEPRFLEMVEQHDLVGLPMVVAARALIDAELGHRDRAREALESMAASGFAAYPLDLTWLLAMAMWSQVAAKLGHVASALVLSDLLRPYADRLAFLATLSLGTMAFHLGLLAATVGDDEAAESQYAASAVTEERIGAPIWLARTRTEWARLLLRRAGAGHVDRARELLRQALATAAELGLANVERQARTLWEATP